MRPSFDPLAQKYPSQRFPIYARGGMVNASSPQASAAGLDVLRQGGNAMDAAVAAAAALTVAEPTANGIGGDAFALIWSEADRRLYGLNSSGRAPALASAERVTADGKARNGKMPVYGWTPVTVPSRAEVTEEVGRLAIFSELTEEMAPVRVERLAAP